METIFLSNVVLLLSTSVFVVAIFRRLNLSPVLGYFVAGALIGKHGFGIISPHETEAFAEFGVVFLLFAIGLELTFERLKSMRSHVFGFGSLQVLFTSALIAYLLHQFGVRASASIIIGGGLALSSTAIVLQVIAEARQQSTQVGRLSLAVLLLQDFAVVPLLVLVPLLSGDKSHSLVYAMGAAFGKAMVALLGIFIMGRLCLRPLFSMITSATTAKSNELFVATTLLIALGSAWGTERLGLSLALGAFVAGLLVAETEFQLQAEESIAPFKGLCLGLFFMTVGMSINIHLIIDKLFLIAALSLSLILIKALIIFALSLLFRFSIGVSIHAGLILAQGSEFAFILFNLAMEKGIIDGEFGQVLLLVVTITMALTPLLSMVGNFFASLLDKKDKAVTSGAYGEIADLENHVIIIGFGRVGKMVARLLEAENVHYVAADINPEHVSEEREDGFPVYSGDGSKEPFLKSIGVDRCRTVIISIDNEVTLKKVAKNISTHFPNTPIVVRAKDLSNSVSLYELGVTSIVPETYETGLQLGGAVLKSVGISELEVNRIKNQFRAGNYVLAKEIDDELDDEQEEVMGYDYMGQPMMSEYEIPVQNINIKQNVKDDTEE